MSEEEDLRDEINAAKEKTKSEIEAAKAQEKTAEAEEETAKEEEKTAEAEEETAKEEEENAEKGKKTKSKDRAKKVESKITKAGGMVASGVASYGASGAKKIGGGWFPHTPFGYFCLITLFIHVFVDGGMFNHNINGIVILLNIAFALIAFFWLFERKPESVTLIFIIFSLEIFLPRLPTYFPILLETPLLKYLFFYPLWPWWFYMSAFYGKSSFTNKMVVLIIIYFLLIFVQQEQLFDNWGTQIEGMGYKQLTEQAGEVLPGGEEIKKTGSYVSEYLVAWWKCYMNFERKNCTDYKKLIGEAETLQQTGEEIEITPTMVELEIEKSGGLLTGGYIQNTGMNIDVNVIRGNDEVEMIFNIDCGFSNNTNNFTGSSNPDIFKIKSDFIAGTYTTAALCKSEDLLIKGSYDFKASVNFGHEAHSVLKNYFIDMNVPETPSLKFFPYYHKIIPAKMNKGIIEVDLTTKKESPMKIDPDEEASLPLRVLFLNKGKGKLDEITKLCLILPDYLSPPPNWGSKCINDDDLILLNQMIKEQEDASQTPHIDIPITMNAGNLFDETNNPIDLNIELDLKYNYVIEKESTFKVI